MSHSNIDTTTNTSESKVPFLSVEPFTLEATTKIFETMAPAVREKFNNDPEKWNAAMNESKTYLNSLPSEYIERVQGASKEWRDKVAAYGKETGNKGFQAEFEDLMSRFARAGGANGELKEELKEMLKGKPELYQEFEEIAKMK